MDDTVDNFDYSQSFLDSSTFDNNAGVNMDNYTLPFSTVDNGNGTAAVTANSNTPGFFESLSSGLGSGFTGLLSSGLSAAATAAPNLLASVLGNRTDPATTPNPAAAAQKPAGATTGSMTGWIIGGAVGLLAIVVLVFTFGRKRSKG